MGRILVIDDDEAIARLIAKVLSRTGYAAVAAVSAQQARALASAESFDLLMVDRNLPGVSGLELINELRRGRPELPAILLTAYAEPLLTPGTNIQGYLGKPFESLTHVVATVARVLEPWRRVNELCSAHRASVAAVPVRR